MPGTRRPTYRTCRPTTAHGRAPFLQVCALLALPDHALVVAGGCTVSAYDMRSLEALQDGPVDLLASLVRCPVCERLLDPPCSKPNEPDVKENAVLTLERKGAVLRISSIQ